MNRLLSIAIVITAFTTVAEGKGHLWCGESGIGNQPEHQGKYDRESIVIMSEPWDPGRIWQPRCEEPEYIATWGLGAKQLEWHRTRHLWGRWDKACCKHIGDKKYPYWEWQDRQ